MERGRMDNPKHCLPTGYDLKGFIERVGLK
jgi:hypothetical protein